MGMIGQTLPLKPQQYYGYWTKRHRPNLSSLYQIFCRIPLGSVSVAENHWFAIFCSSNLNLPENFPSIVSNFRTQIRPESICSATMSNSLNSSEKFEEVDWELRPGGMLVQRRDGEEEDGGAGSGSEPMLKISVSHGSSQHEVLVPAHSTFGDLKKVIAQKTGLEPEDHKLLFRGKEKDDEEDLQMAGVKDNSKIMVTEDLERREMRLEEAKKRNAEVSKQCEAVAVVRAEVDKLAERVSVLGVAVEGGTKVADKEFDMSTELLMKQLLKLDGIVAEGEARLQRKAEVCRVQNFVETLDALKARNSNPSTNNNNNNAVSITTKWETFDSGVGSLSAPPPKPSAATNVEQDWERFD